MATRTAKGTAKAKASGTTLTLSSVAVTDGDLLVVGVAYASNSVFPSSVTFGTKNMRLRSGSRVTNSSATLTCEMWTKRIKRTRTATITITWPSAINAKVMIASTLTGAVKRDRVSTGQSDADTTPRTGAAATTQVDGTFHIAFLASKGPSNDTQGTADLGHTLGQRDGTAGPPPVSNVTLQETYEVLTATGDCRGGVTVSTADWANCIMAFRDFVDYPTLDNSGSPIVTGDTVYYQDVSSTVSTITKEDGLPAVLLTLADGRQIWSHSVGDE